MMNRQAISIPGRVLASLLSIFVATYSATAIVVYTGVRASILESNATALTHLAQSKYEQLANRVDALATDLAAWSELDVMNDLASGDIDKRIAAALEALKRQYALPGTIYALDVTGRLLACSDPRPIDATTRRILAMMPVAGRGLAIVGKFGGAVGGADIVLFEIPVYGRFDRNFRIGALAMTYPWSSLERDLATVDDATVLTGVAAPHEVLAAVPRDLAARAGFEIGRAAPSAVMGEFIVGRSSPRTGLASDWQVVAIERAANATRTLRLVVMELAALGIGLAIPIVFLGRWLSRRLTSPIADLTRVVKEIAETDKLDARVPVTSSDELGSLARSFNHMTENLERTTRDREHFVNELATLNMTLEAKIAERTEDLEDAVTAQRRLVGDISHEIKSPLARLSMALGLARRAADTDKPRQFDRMEREIENISALVSELLTLARLDGSAGLPPFEELDIGRLVADIVSDACYETPTRSMDVVFRQPARRMTVHGNAELLRRAIENVVRNAIFYTSEGTPIGIVVKPTSPTFLTIEIRDNGPGVPAEALSHLFEPFYRVDEARARETGGTGIGLAICQRVVHAHAGKIDAQGNQPHGLIVTIELPRIASP